MAERHTTTFGALGQLFDGPHATPARRDEGPYFLNISSLKAGRLDLSESDHVSAEDFVTWTRRVTPKKDDLLFSYETRLGEAALMPEGVNACLGRRMALLRPDTSVVDPRFLLYYILSPPFQAIIAKHTIHGATVTRIGLATMPSWEVALPPMCEQRAIAEVLGALDDKIAANRCALDTADELVRARYDALRGDSIVLGAIATNVRDQVDPTALLPETPYVGLEHVPRRSMWLSDFESAAKVTSAKAAFRAGDVLFGKLRPYFHKVVSAPVDGIASTDILVLRAKRPELAGLVLAAASSDGAIAATTASSEGTRMPRTKWEDLAAVEISWPGDDEARRFSSEVSTLADWVCAAVMESRELAATRDELLPLLMSGKVRVRDVEKVVEGVA
jgi:type I restriction enzyme, S subunit